MMGALEAADGMLLFGISTAYIFAVMQMYWPILSESLVTPRHPHEFDQNSRIRPLPKARNRDPGGY